MELNAYWCFPVEEYAYQSSKPPATFEQVMHRTAFYTRNVPEMIHVPASHRRRLLVPAGLTFLGTKQHRAIEWPPCSFGSHCIVKTHLFRAIVRGASTYITDEAQPLAAFVTPKEYEDVLHGEALPLDVKTRPCYLDMILQDCVHASIFESLAPIAGLEPGLIQRTYTRVDVPDGLKHKYMRPVAERHFAGFTHPISDFRLDLLAVKPTIVDSAYARQNYDERLLRSWRIHEEEMYYKDDDDDGGDDDDVSIIDTSNGLALHSASLPAYYSALDPIGPPLPLASVPAYLDARIHLFQSAFVRHIITREQYNVLKQKTSTTTTMRRTTARNRSTLSTLAAHFDEYARHVTQTRRIKSSRKRKFIEAVLWLVEALNNQGGGSGGGVLMHEPQVCLTVRDFCLAYIWNSDLHCYHPMELDVDQLAMTSSTCRTINNMEDIYNDKTLTNAIIEQSPAPSSTAASRRKVVDPILHILGNSTGRKHKNHDVTQGIRVLPPTLILRWLCAAVLGGNPTAPDCIDLIQHVALRRAIHQSNVDLIRFLQTRDDHKRLVQFFYLLCLFNTPASSHNTVSEIEQMAVQFRPQIRYMRDRICNHHRQSAIDTTTTTPANWITPVESTPIMCRYLYPEMPTLIVDILCTVLSRDASNAVLFSVNGQSLWKKFHRTKKQLVHKILARRATIRAPRFVCRLVHRLFAQQHGRLSMREFVLCAELHTELGVARESQERLELIFTQYADQCASAATPTDVANVTRKCINRLVQLRTLLIQSPNRTELDMQYVFYGLLYMTQLRQIHVHTLPRSVAAKQLAAVIIRAIRYQSTSPEVLARFSQAALCVPSCLNNRVLNKKKRQWKIPCLMEPVNTPGPAVVNQRHTDAIVLGYNNCIANMKGHVFHAPKLQSQDTGDQRGSIHALTLIPMPGRILSCRGIMVCICQQCGMLHMTRGNKTHGLMHPCCCCCASTNKNMGEKYS